MNPTEYEKNVLITESSDFPAIRARIDDRMIRLLHAGLGLSSELAELVDAICKEDADIDYVNVSEEIGDCCWYTSIAVNALGFDPENISGFEKIAKESGELKIKDVENLRTTVFSLTWNAGEFNDLLKKYLLYGKEFNATKAEQLLKTLCLCMAGVCEVCNTTLEKVRETNITKLKARFGSKFTELAALNRDLDTERKILEEGV